MCKLQHNDQEQEYNRLNSLERHISTILVLKDESVVTIRVIKLADQVEQKSMEGKGRISGYRNNLGIYTSYELSEVTGF